MVGREKILEENTPKNEPTAKSPFPMSGKEEADMNRKIEAETERYKRSVESDDYKLGDYDEAPIEE